MFALYRLRTLDLDRQRIADTITFSGATTRPMYISLIVLVTAGAVAGYQGGWFDDWWIWISIVVLIATTVLMTVTAKPYFKRISAACAMRPSGVPRTSDEELGELVRSSKVHLITAIGVGGLAVIIWLMVTKPGQTF
jgi:ABC-type dipeptide/oligopeptide/nickel transport system permease subunit